MRIPVLVVLYAVAAAASIWLTTSSSTLAALWLPNALAFLLWFRRERRDNIANLSALATGISVANLAAGMPILASILLAGANTLEVAASITIARWVLAGAASATNAAKAALLMVTVGLIAPLIGASAGSFILHTATNTPFILVWLTWLSGSMLGTILLLPIGLTISLQDLKALKAPRMLATTILFLMAAAAVPIIAINIMRFPFVAVALPIALAAALLSPLQTALVSASAILSVYFSSFLFLGQMEAGYYSVEIGAASALAAVPSILFSLLQAEFRESQAKLGASERLFRTAMANSAIGMAIVDNLGQIREANARFGQHLGYTAEELCAVSFQQITHADDLAADESLVQELLDGKRDRYEIEKRYIKKNGDPVWGLLAVSIIRGTRAGEVDFFVSQIVDIDERKKHEAQLKDVNDRLFDEKERLRITLYSIGDAVITTDRWARITFMNPVAERLTGWNRLEAEGLPLSTVFNLIMEATGEHVSSPVDECLQRGQPYYLQDGVALVTRDGQILGIQDSAAPVRGPDGVIHGAVLIFQDVSEARSLQRELLYSAMHDSLTDLPNRRSFEERLTEACVDVSGRVARHVVGYLDLDRFKLINDTAGHAAGDAALKDVARLLKSMLRTDDTVARFGGDEFGLILRNCSIEKATEIGEKLVTAIRASAFHWDGRSYELGASLGLAEISGARRDPTELLVQADIACYAAKSAGRNRVFAYHGESHDALQHRRDMDIATTLKSAVEQGRFLLFAQELAPISPKAAAGRSFEIFVRLIGTDGDYISPVVFIPAAERYNMMSTIDKWVISESLKSCSNHLRRNPHDKIAINLSVSSIDDRTLSSYIEERLRENDVRPCQVCFEITETALMSNVSASLDFISCMQGIGANIALDDFGVGMSSFSYLKLFKADTIKIDASFVRDVNKGGRDREIIGAIVGLATALGIETVAEGIETLDQLIGVRDLGVTTGQGYYFCRPGPIESIMVNHSLDRARIGTTA